MSDLSTKTRVRLSIINGVATGGIAAFIYAKAAGEGNELWQALTFHPLNYVAMILVCCLNTYVYFGWLAKCDPIKPWKGSLMGAAIAAAGSFLCSLVMGIGTGRIGELEFGTAFFLPISGFVGAIAGVVLANIVMNGDERA